MKMKDIQNFFRDFMFPISAIGSAAAAILTFIGFCAVFLNDRDWVKDNGFFDAIGDWSLWFLIIGIFLFMFSIFYLYDNVMSRKKFNRLIDTPSKSKILHNFDEIDRLAYKLGSSHLITWRDIKRKHRIKR